MPQPFQNTLSCQRQRPFLIPVSAAGNRARVRRDCTHAEFARVLRPKIESSKVGGRRPEIED
eukprot:10351433-Alexandrium_andersonii.AAC.1